MTIRNALKPKHYRWCEDATRADPDFVIMYNVDRDQVWNEEKQAFEVLPPRYEVIGDWRGGRKTYYGPNPNKLIKHLRRDYEKDAYSRLRKSYGG